MKEVTENVGLIPSPCKDCALSGLRSHQAFSTCLPEPGHPGLAEPPVHVPFHLQGDFTLVA